MRVIGMHLAKRAIFRGARNMPAEDNEEIGGGGGVSSSYLRVICVMSPVAFFPLLAKE